MFGLNPQRKNVALRARHVEHLTGTVLALHETSRTRELLGTAWSTSPGPCLLRTLMDLSDIGPSSAGQPRLTGARRAKAGSAEAEQDARARSVCEAPRTASERVPVRSAPRPERSVAVAVAVPFIGRIHRRKRRRHFVRRRGRRVRLRYSVRPASPGVDLRRSHVTSMSGRRTMIEIPRARVVRGSGIQPRALPRGGGIQPRVLPRALIWGRCSVVSSPSSAG
jgi:hypothetical protein